jgi:hypothetical protein
MVPSKKEVNMEAARQGYAALNIVRPEG